MREIVSYLINDILNAHHDNGFEVEETVQTIEQHFDDVEKYLNGMSSNLTFGEYCGIESKYFPPADYFSEEELSLICKEFEKMMYTWNLAYDYPEKLPISLIYNALIETLDTQTTIVSSGMIHFDFCTGYAPECVWKEYCPCLEIWNRDDDYENYNKGL
ncbi:hypothetical protein [Chryseobacterium sp. Leaf394]|uniref:hypothetical protein n=1 Tax=Chryseobacterium sp. Leaf394 TaxID=1736361 RepID=UPI0006FDC500|nr:hypothetical protein [Chryseobacterium sp. Leaf394]KQS88833.1 hypothetical protein ASG21_17020 [Chryseobacterium sp. Leaf394]